MRNHRLNTVFPAKYDFWLTLIGIPVVSVLVNTLLFGFLLQTQDYTLFLKCTWLSLGFTTMFWFFFRYVFFFYVRKYPREEDNKTRRIKTLIIILSLFVILQINIEVITRQMESISDIKPHFLIKMITVLLVSFFIIFLYEIIFLSTQIAHSMAEKEALKKENIASELSGLKEQINPHFLFNSLNTLSSLITTNPDKAESFVSKLSKVYRYILDKSGEDLVVLDQELKYLESYIHLLKERFGESLVVNIAEFDQQIRAKKIIPLSLQICFENCVKHNVVTKENPLTVDIHIQNDTHIFITNNLQKLNLSEPASGVGISNIKKRNDFFTKIPVIIKQDESIFSIGLPLIND